MTNKDLIERLRSSPSHFNGDRTSAMLTEAAALIEQQEALLADLIKVLKPLLSQADHVAVGSCIPSMNIHDAAKELGPLVDNAEAALLAAKTHLEGK